MKKTLLLAASIAVMACIGTVSAEPNVAPALVDGHKAAPQESGIAPATPNVAPQAKPQDASDLAGGHRADPQETGIIAPVAPTVAAQPKGEGAVSAYPAAPTAPEKPAETGGSAPSRSNDHPAKTESSATITVVVPDKPANVTVEAKPAEAAAIKPGTPEPCDDTVFYCPVP